MTADQYDRLRGGARDPSYDYPVYHFSMDDALRPPGDVSDLVKAYQRPYQQPCDAGALLEALQHGALKNVWPFRDDSDDAANEKAA